MDVKTDEKRGDVPILDDNGHSLAADDLINASGHVQELDRTFSFWAICGQAVMCDNAWGAGAGALVVSLYNGGGPGVLYGLLVSTFFYAFINAGLAELASAIPSSANVYHWASVTGGPNYGKICSWYAGWWNCVAWIFGSSAPSLFAAEAVIAMYTLYHPLYVPQRWHIFIPFLCIVWFDTAIVCFGQRYLARFISASGILCILILVVSLLMVAIYPSTTSEGYASNSFVWGDFQNLTGWSSNGLVFLMGMLNGAFTIGTPDGVAHLCEETPNPKVNIPKGIFVQLVTGTVTSFAFYVAVLYGITSLDDVYATNIVSLPLAAMYQQATRSTPATFALLFLFFVDLIICLPGAWVVAGRMLWTLARDDAAPFSGFLKKVSLTWRNPFNAQVTCAVGGTILGAIYVGSATAFNAFVASFIIFTTMSYLAAILPHLLTGRKYVKPGPFWISGVKGFIIQGIGCVYIVLFNILYMFPYVYPVPSLDLMNWTSVLFAGITFLMTLGYFWKRNRGYKGPHVVQDAHDDIMKGMIGLDQQLDEQRRHSMEN